MQPRISVMNKKFEMQQIVMCNEQQYGSSFEHVENQIHTDTFKRLTNMSGIWNVS